MEASKWYTDRRWMIDVSIGDGQGQASVVTRLRDLTALYLTSNMGPPARLRDRRFFHIQEYL